MNNTLNHLKDMEITLHQHEVRTDVEKLSTILHPEFTEIGYSGTTYDYDSIVKELISEQKSTTNVYSQDYEFKQLAPSVFQLTYLSAHEDKLGNLTRHAKRSSIWINSSGSWKIVHHQGTPTAPFKKQFFAD